MIGPHRTSGEANGRDWLHLLLRAIAAVRAVPLLSDRDYATDLLPVDVASAALARLGAMGLQSRRDAGAGEADAAAVFHLDARSFRLSAVPVLATLVAALERECGPFERDVPYSEWRESLRAVGGATEAALAVLPAPSTADHGAVLRMRIGERAGLGRLRAIRLAEATH